MDIKRDIDLFGLPKSRRSGVGMQIEHSVNNNNTTNTNNNRVATAADVKTERLSPVAAAGGDSASSRSGTPSSSCYPGTPPGVTAAADRVSSPAPNRNCSDLIRSLAAKYQNANPSEWVTFYDLYNDVDCLSDRRGLFPKYLSKFWRTIISIRFCMVRILVIAVP